MGWSSGQYRGGRRVEKHAEVGAPPEAAPMEGSTVEGARWGSTPRFPTKSSTARSEAL